MKTSGIDFAFPATERHLENGLTKREYFAVAIFQGMLAGGSGISLDDRIGARQTRVAVELADSLIAALNQKE